MTAANLMPFGPLHALSFAICMAPWAFQTFMTFVLILWLNTGINKICNIYRLQVCHCCLCTTLETVHRVIQCTIPFFIVSVVSIFSEERHSATSLFAAYHTQGIGLALCCC